MEHHTSNSKYYTYLIAKSTVKEMMKRIL